MSSSSARDVQGEQPTLGIGLLGERNLVVPIVDLRPEVVEELALPFSYGERLAQSILDELGDRCAGDDQEVVDVGAYVPFWLANELLVAILLKDKDAGVERALLEAVASAIYFDVDFADSFLEVKPPLTGTCCQAEDIFLHPDQLPRLHAWEASRRLMYEQLLLPAEINACQEGALDIACGHPPWIRFSKPTSQHLQQAKKSGSRQSRCIRSQATRSKIRIGMPRSNEA